MSFGWSAGDIFSSVTLLYKVGDWYLWYPKRSEYCTLEYARAVQLMDLVEQTSGSRQKTPKYLTSQPPDSSRKPERRKKGGPAH